MYRGRFRLSSSVNDALAHLAADAETVIVVVHAACAQTLAAVYTDPPVLSAVKAAVPRRPVRLASAGTIMPAANIRKLVVQRVEKLVATRRFWSQKPMFALWYFKSNTSRHLSASTVKQARRIKTQNRLSLWLSPVNAIACAAILEHIAHFFAAASTLSDPFASLLFFRGAPKFLRSLVMPPGRYANTSRTNPAGISPFTSCAVTGWRAGSSGTRRTRAQRPWPRPADTGRPAAG